MSRLWALILIFQGFLMSASLEQLTIGDTNVPLIFEEDKTLPIVTARVVFVDAGSQGSPKAGLSRFAFRMLGEGTAKLGSAKFAQMLEQRAIRISFHGGSETGSAEFSVLKEQAQYAAKNMAAVFADPNLNKESFEKVKIQTLSTIAKRADDFDFVADDRLRRTIFEGTPIEHGELGEKEQISKLKSSDISSFLKEALVLKKAIVVIGGDLSLEEAKKLGLAMLKPLPVGKEPKQDFYNGNANAKELRIEKKTQQAYIYFGAPLLLKQSDKDAYKSRVASYILGAGGFGSRLMETIRVKEGLAYSAYSRHTLSKTNSLFTGHLQTKLENEKKAIELVKKTIDEFVKNGATQKELESAKKFILGSEPLRNETLSQRIGRSFNEYYTGLGIGYAQKELQMIETLTLDELNTFIAAHPEIGKLTFSIVTKN